MAEFLKVNEVLNSLDLKENMSAAEFGCGNAMFTVSLAKKLGKGKVYAMDIQEEKLSALKGRLFRENINNVSSILCDLEDPDGSTLKNDFLDIVIVANVLFQTTNKYAIMKEGVRVLKKGGQLLAVDWLKKSPFGPEEIVDPDEVKKMANDLNLSLKKEFAAGDYHYGLLFTK